MGVNIMDSPARRARGEKLFVHLAETTVMSRFEVVA